MATGKTADAVDAPKLTVERLLEKTRPERTVAIDLAGDGTEFVELRLRAITRKAYDDLVQAHPPMPGDESGWPFDVEGFAPALIAETLIEPQLSIAEARQIWIEWDSASVMALWRAAIDVCTARSSAGKDTSTTAG